ncbi:hypothetical protein WAI453_006498 [Rhynchosporium graminicola]
MPLAQSFLDSITVCFDNDTYSDLTIKCRDRSWKVHRVIVCSQSNVLHAACMAGFKEAHTGVIDLDNDEPVSVEIMLKYFYTGKYNELGPTPEEYLSVISDVYTVPTPTNALRAIVVEYARIKFRDMTQNADLEILRAMLQDVPEFAFDVLQLFVNAPLRGRCSSCGPNQNAEALQTWMSFLADEAQSLNKIYNTKQTWQSR